MTDAIRFPAFSATTWREDTVREFSRTPPHWPDQIRVFPPDYRYVGSLYSLDFFYTSNHSHRYVMVAKHFAHHHEEFEGLGTFLDYTNTHPILSPDQLDVVRAMYAFAGVPT